MVLVASVGLPSKTGSSVPFVRAMSHRWRLVVASVTAIAPLALFGGPAAIAAIACSSIAAVFIAILATRGFGGITGFGAHHTGCSLKKYVHGSYDVLHGRIRY